MKRVITGTMVLLCLLISVNVSAQCLGTIFTDVNSSTVGEMFCEYIERFSTLGITTGYPDGTYRPFNNTNRQQMAAFIMRTIDNVVQRKYEKVAVVEPYGNGDYTNPATAMADYANWCGTPTQINPCLLKIMPGFYDIGTGSVVMQAYIDIEGSGENVTRIQGHVGGNTAGVVVGANLAEIRFLTIINEGGQTGDAVGIFHETASPEITNVTVIARNAGISSIGIYNWNLSAPILTNVDIVATGAGSSSVGMYSFDFSTPILRNVQINVYDGGTANYGIYLENFGVLTLSNVTINSSGTSPAWGIINNSSQVVNINNSHIEADNYAVLNANDGGNVTIDHSIIKGANSSVRNDNSSADYFVGASKLDGPVSANVKCVASYDGSYNAITCP